MESKLDTQITELRALMETQLRVKGRDLDQQRRRAGRLLPGKLRRDLRFLIDTHRLEANPKLAPMINQAKADQAHARLVNFLQKQDPRKRIWDRLISIAASIALVVLVVFAVGLYVLVQRGFV